MSLSRPNGRQMVAKTGRSPDSGEQVRKRAFNRLNLHKMDQYDNWTIEFKNSLTREGQLEDLEQGLVEFDEWCAVAHPDLQPQPSPKPAEKGMP